MAFRLSKRHFGLSNNLFVTYEGSKFSLKSCLCGKNRTQEGSRVQERSIVQSLSKQVHMAGENLPVFRLITRNVF